MNTANYTKLSTLRATVVRSIPDTALTSNIWHFLGWSEEASEAYLIAKARGIDLRPLIAPDFSDIVSIVIDGAYGFPFGAGNYQWDGILNGDFLDFVGINAKQRLLSVLDSALKECLDS